MDYNVPLFVITGKKKNGATARSFRNTIEAAYVVVRDWEQYPDVIEVIIHEFNLLHIIDDAVDEALNVYPDNYVYRWGRIES